MGRRRGGRVAGPENTEKARAEAPGGGLAHLAEGACGPAFAGPDPATGMGYRRVFK
ncbi:hypothetical protein GCM10010151_73670 [Actinoallomurus spadix]|uniref:Uncharacterized protein n=1 Tax=Actinoallomurus spadix TaxID=79912 RepID=A0ABP3HKS6_9ACTN